MKRLKGNSPETIQQVAGEDGLWLCGDTEHPTSMILILSDFGELHALRREPADFLRLDGFKPSATFYGPFRPEDVNGIKCGDEIYHTEPHSSERFRFVPISTIIRDRQSFILGMELAMRIVRNSSGTFFNGQKPDETMLGSIIAMIRLVQVEMGSGRMALPMFSEEETAEVERIS